MPTFTDEANNPQTPNIVLSKKHKTSFGDVANTFSATIGMQILNSLSVRFTDRTLISRRSRTEHNLLEPYFQKL